MSCNADGNLAGYDDGMTSASYTYDALGRKLSETVNYGTFTKSFSYTYYSNGLKESFTAPDGTTYEYAYGSNNELREVRIPGLGSITISDYQWNRPATIRYPGGSTREYEYDALMRLKHLTAKDPGGNSIFDYSYEYDNIGNIVSKTTEHGTYNYGYDGASRLTSADNPTLEDEAYSYDVVGNRTSASNADGNITHNTNNELLMYGDVEYVYDDNGNLTEVQLDGQVMFRYHYNAENRLMKVEGGNSNTIAEYYYDPFGRRLWKEVNGVRTYFFYSDEGLIAEYDKNGTELTSYGYQPDSTWTTDPLFLKQNGSYYFYQNDHLGTPQKLVAQNGAVVWSATYSAFGQASVSIETITNNLRFPGQYYDAETGLYYNFHRHYDPGIGRYISVDPIGFASGGMNLFVYVQNRPLIYFDESGLKIQGIQVVRGHVSDGIYGWDYQYCQDECSVTIRIKLIDKTPPYLNDPILETWRRHPDKILERWETGAEKKWSNKFACCDPDGFTDQRLCCKGLCLITVDVQFVTSEEDAIVEIHHGWSRVFPGLPARPGVFDWFTVNSGDTIAHEIGHHLGLKDEYVDLGMAPNRYPVNTETVMGNSAGGPAVLRHFQDICKNIGKVLTTLRGTGLE